MGETHNLFLQLHKWASRQDENFTTDAFVHVLRHLAETSPQAALEVLRALGAEDLGVEVSEIPRLRFHTQRTWLGNRRPDVSILAEDLVWLIEVKVEAAIDRPQLRSYLEILERSDRQRKALSLLAPIPTFYKVPPGTRAVHWFDVSDVLVSLMESGGIRGETNRYLVAQLLSFLFERRLGIVAAGSPVSKGLRDYERRIGMKLVFDKKANRPIVESEPELQPLWNLLLLMKEAWLQVWPDSSVRYASGEHSGGWFGWSVDNMTYFFWVQYSNPDVIGFQIYQEPTGIDGKKWEELQGEARQGEVVRVLGHDRWDRYLDLTSGDPSFFSLPGIGQRKVLVSFIQECRNFADRLFLT